MLLNVRVLCDLTEILYNCELILACILELIIIQFSSTDINTSLRYKSLCAVDIITIFYINVLLFF